MKTLLNRNIFFQFCYTWAAINRTQYLKTDRFDNGKYLYILIVGRPKTMKIKIKS